MTADKILEKIREILSAQSVSDYIRPITVNRLKLKDYQKHQEERIKVAKTLADNIYNLSNLERVIDPQAYQSIFKRNLAGRTSEDNQFILKYAQKYFREHFGEAIKRNGESPEIIEQIVKRTGKDTRIQFEAVIAGFNAQQLAQKIYRIDLTQIKSLTLIQTELERLDPEQLRELQAEIKIIYLREIAELTNKFLDPQKPDFRCLQLLLQNKTNQEIEKVIKIIEESYLLKEGQDTPGFTNWLEKNFAGYDLQTIKRALSGLNLNYLAEEINWIFTNSELLWVDFAGLQTQKLGKLILHVDHNQSKTSQLNREIRLRPFIQAITYFLHQTQFESLNALILSSYGYQLTTEFYLPLEEPTPLNNYLKLEKALTGLASKDSNKMEVCSSDYRNSLHNLTKQDSSFDNSPPFNIILARLLFIYTISEEQLVLFKDSCLSNSKNNLFDILQKNLTQKNHRYDYSNLIEVLSSGLAQQITDFEINDHFDRLVSRNSLTENLKYLADVERKLLNLIENFDITPEEKAVLLINELQKLNRQELIDIDRLFYFKNDSSLLLKIKPLISPAAFLKVQIILCGFNPKLEAKSVIENFNWKKLLQLTPLQVALLDSELKKAHSITLLDFLEKQTVSEVPEDILLAPAFFPLASQLKQKILEPQAWGNLETEYVLNNFRNTPTRLKALEVAYNLLFSNQELSQESSLGSWRNSFIVQVQQKNIDKIEYTNLLSLAEGIPITLIPEISKITTASDRGIEDLHQLDLILRTYRPNLKIIKMLYLIFDGELSLRERIYKFKVLPRDENLSLLLLDGYDPEKLAQEFITLFKSPNKLSVQSIYDLLNPKYSTVIPIKDNWKEEMYHQLRIRYEIFCGRRLVTDILTLVKDQSELEIVRKICDLLYGDMSTKCFALQQALLATNADPKLIVKKLQNFKPSQVEQMDHLYSSYFGLSLVEELVKFFPDDEDDRFAEALFLRSSEWEQEKLKLKIEAEEN